MEAAVTAATVKVMGESCRRIQEGSGFVITENVVVTNAHVVAGEEDVDVLRPDGKRLPATVVVFDAKRDLAVLRVDKLGMPSLGRANAEAGASGAVFGVAAVDDEFFVVVRPVPGGASILLSDATAALDYDLAADALDLLQIPTPEEDEIDDDPWPEGDLALLADLGLPEQEMQLIVSETDLYPDEQLALIAQRCGFGDQFAALLEKV